MIAAMTISDWTSLGISIGGIAAAVYAGVMHFRVRRKGEWDTYAASLEKTTADLISTKDGVIQTLQSDRDAWKSRFEAEHTEFVTHRAKSHSQIEEANARIIGLTNENADLKAKTDITPVLEFQSRQSQINEQVLKGLSLIVQKLDGIGVPHPEPR